MKKKLTGTSFISRRHRASQRGQTMIFVVLGLSLVFLAVLGFAVDFGNLWFHRQAAQTASDAACTAAVMDMLSNAQGGTDGGFTNGTNFDCKASPNAAPCKYANLNGYTGAGTTANTASNSLSFSFGSTVSGIPTCTTPPDPTITMCIPPTAFIGSPIVEVSLVDRINTYFFGLVSSSRTIDVPAKSTCGVVLATSPIPILVLDPTRGGTLSGNGNIEISIVGGPSRSIQVNSGSTPATNGAAVSIAGASGAIDLSKAGPAGTGADFGVTGANTKPAILSLGTTGAYVSPDSRISDPFALMSAPAKPNFAPGGAGNPGCCGASGNGLSKDGTDVAAVPKGTLGCPDATCHRYTPGWYPNGIEVKNFTAIFDPGIYYIEKGFTAAANSCMRPSEAVGDGSGGTVFYFADAASISVAANSGNNCPSDPTTFFNTSSGNGSLANGVKCTSTSTIPVTLTPTISGTVLLAPCTGPDSTKGMCSPNCGINGGNGFGDQLGASDPGGIQRGMLFFQNRGVTLANKDQPAWSGGGTFLLSGTMYFHQCNTTGVDSGVGCTNAAFTDTMTLGGGSGSGTYVLGQIVVDHLNLGGNPNLTMVLNPNASYWILKASLLK